MIEYAVWDPEDGDEARARKVSAPCSRSAAEQFVEGRWEAMDCPESIVVAVRDPDGDLTTWTVAARQDVSFRATLVERVPA